MFDCDALRLSILPDAGSSFVPCVVSAFFFLAWIAWVEAERPH